MNDLLIIMNSSWCVKFIRTKVETTIKQNNGLHLHEKQMTLSLKILDRVMFTLMNF